MRRGGRGVIQGPWVQLQGLSDQTDDQEAEVAAGEDAQEGVEGAGRIGYSCDTDNKYSADHFERWKSTALEQYHILRTVETGNFGTFIENTVVWWLHDAIWQHERISDIKPPHVPQSEYGDGDGISDDADGGDGDLDDAAEPEVEAGEAEGGDGVVPRVRAIHITWYWTRYRAESESYFPDIDRRIYDS